MEGACIHSGQMANSFLCVDVPSANSVLALAALHTMYETEHTYTAILPCCCVQETEGVGSVKVTT